MMTDGRVLSIAARIWPRLEISHSCRGNRVAAMRRAAHKVRQFLAQLALRTEHEWFHGWRQR